MQTNNLFLYKRFLLLCRQSLIINKKIIAIALSAFTGTLFIALILFQSVNHFELNWELKHYSVLFILLFFFIGVGYSSSAFPAFRSKEKSLTYLMLPATLPEKFVFEFLTRIVLFFVLMPLLFWGVVYIESGLIHQFVPDFEQFNVLNSSWNHGIFSVPSNGTSDSGPFGSPHNYYTIQNMLLILLTTFTGASHFTKSPFLKTMLTVAIIYAGYGIFISLLVKGLNLNSLNSSFFHLLFFRNQNDAVAIQHDAVFFASLVLTVINLTLLSIAFFRLKEKEI
jgi:hypothetical protein